MFRRFTRLAWACVLTAVAAAGCGGATPAPGSRYEDLVALFAEWRAFQRPMLVDGVPDYTAAAMAAQHRALAGMRRRLAAIDPRRLARRAAGRLARRARRDERPRLRSSRAAAVGEQPGVLRHGLPDAERPARARGPVRVRRRGALELHVPALGRRARPRSSAGVRAIPALLAQAKGNLVGNGRDLWTFGIGSIREQSADLEQFAARLGGEHAGLKARVRRRNAPPTSSPRGSSRRRRRRPGRRASASRTTTGT